jgi:predicted methyltransferase
MRAALLALLALPIFVSAADTAAIQAAIDGTHRSAASSTRDVYRRPAETLGFCGLEADQAILEIWPGGGWYTDILAPVVRDQGSYTAAIFGPNTAPGFRPQLDADLLARFAAAPEVYGDPNIVPLWVPQDLDLGPADSIDTVFTFRNLHNWLKGGYAPEILAAVYSVLRPGGTFCVVDHRADARMPIDTTAEAGYVDDAYAINLIQQAGFRLAEVSDALDNPRDSADHPLGVWTLPPMYRLGDQDRDEYAAIGESDRFLLRFVKPD